MSDQKQTHWATKRLPPEVWQIAFLIRMGLTRYGIDLIPREFLVPKNCPRCKAEAIVENEELVRCGECGYSRANIVHRGSDLTVGELLGLATELAQNAATKTLIQRLKDAVKTR